MAESTTDIIQHASVAGELAPNLWGRSDFEKYDSAWAEARNWWVDYRGGLLTRPGSVFGDIIPWTAGDRVRYFPFQYSPDTTNTYICVFTNSVVRFIQDNAWVLEASKAIASVANGAGNRLTVTSNAHGFANGDLIKVAAFVHASLTYLNGRTVLAANITANTFDLADAITGSLITKAGISTSVGTASRVYTIVSPYSNADLLELQAEQISDTLRLTHHSYPIKNLTRSAATSWAIANESIGRALAQVTSLTSFAGSSTGANDYGFLYAVSAVDENGNEGLPAYVFCTSAPDVLALADANPNRLTWTAVSGAVEYRVYASRSLRNATDTTALKTNVGLGYIGTAVGASFTDDGITRDFTSQPRTAGNPFANGRIKYVNVTVQGAGYAFNSTITWPVAGSGAIGYLVCYSGGASPIFGVQVLDGGHDYTAAAVTAATGAGATMAAVVSPASGNNPRHSALFQQRQVYVSTDNEVLSIYGSRPGQFSNFDTTDAGLDDDAYQFDLDSDVIAPIRHVIATPGGLLLFSQVGLWLVYARETKALVPDNARSDIQTKVGANNARPIFLETQVLYASSAGQELRVLVFDSYNNVYQSQNVSLLSNHLFKPENTVVRLAYAPSPRKLAYAVQEDGTLLSVAIDQANGVYACTPNYTQGYYREVCVVEEANNSSIYVAVERYIQSTRCLFFERFSKREFDRLEESFCVDAGLSLAKTTPTGRLTPSSLTGAVTFTVTGGTPFAAGDVGKILRCGDGKATITGFTSSTVLTGTWTRTLTNTIPETTSPLPFDTGDWYLDATATSITGLWHLIGQTAAILADGAVVTPTAVDSEGKLTLSAAASRVMIGLGYTCRAKTLPPTATDAVIEGRKKDIVGINMRVQDTYGLKIGSDLTKLFAVADRNNRLFGTVAAFRNTVIGEKVRASWSKDQQVYIVQSDPLPGAILSFIRDMDVGDEK